MVDDGDLVVEARSGSAAAFANIFDRHAGRVHDFALAALRDRELALEVVDATFVTASQRLHGLDDPNRLGVWLLAIARHESALRAGPVAGPDRQPNLPTDDPERAELARLVWEGVAGFPLRDRALLDLDLRQGLDGQDLADALGVSLTQAYDLQGRMRDRLEKALSGYVIARTGIERSPALQKELKGWDGQLTPPVAKRIANVVDSDRAMNQLRFTLPSVFALYAAALPAPFPAVVRGRVLDSLYLPVPGADGVVMLPPGAEPWLPTGFPPPSFVVTDERTTNRGLIFGVAAVALALVLLAGLLYLLVNNKGETSVATETTTTLPAVIGDPTTSSSAPAATTSTLPGGTIPVATTGTAPTVPRPVVPGTVSPGTPPRNSPGTSPGARPGTSPGTAGTRPAASPANVSAPAVVDFGRSSSEQPATLRNTGGSSASFTTTTGGSAVTVSPASGTIPAGGSTTVRIRINRGSFPEGPINTQVAFNTTAGGKVTDLRGTIARPPSITASIAGNKCTGQWQLRADVSDESDINPQSVTARIGSSTVKMNLQPGGSPSSQVYLSDPQPATSAALPFEISATDKWGGTGGVSGTTPSC